VLCGDESLELVIAELRRCSGHLDDLIPQIHAEISMKELNEDHPVPSSYSREQARINEQKMGVNKFASTGEGGGLALYGLVRAEIRSFLGLDFDLSTMSYFEMSTDEDERFLGARPFLGHMRQIDAHAHHAVVRCSLTSTPPALITVAGV
jgi:hypothetical protein